eukprot:1158222-Pelagomonas_calceolata.AAC.5
MEFTRRFMLGLLQRSREGSNAYSTPSRSRCKQGSTGRVTIKTCWEGNVKRDWAALHQGHDARIPLGALQ